MKPEELKKWIESMKPGDPAAFVDDRCWINDEIKWGPVATHVAKLEKITATGMLSFRVDGKSVLVRGTTARYSFDVGRVRGRLPGIGREIQPVNPELEKNSKLHREHLAREEDQRRRRSAAPAVIHGCSFRSLPLEALEEVAAIVKRATDDGKATP